MTMASIMLAVRKQHSILAQRALRALEGTFQDLVGHTKGDPSSSNPFAHMLPWELASEAALTVPREADEYGSALFEFAGMCHIRSALPPELVDACLSKANDHTSRVLQTVAARGIDPEAVPGFRFHEASQRGPGRTDMRFFGETSAAPPPFDDARILGEDAAWLPLVRRCLGGDAKLLFQGLVATEPGTGEQALHSDGPHVGEQWRLHDASADQALGAQHPCHCLTVFVPLVDLNADNGATNFLPGTHHSAIASAALEAEAEEAGSSGGAGRFVQLHPKAGDAILFDYRLFHAGAANRSLQRRPILYMIYARPWYSDDFNFAGKDATLFETVQP